MPHAELRYSERLDLNVRGLLAGIEMIIQQHDAASGDCKGRAYPAATSHHDHVLLTVMMLEKPHRDAAFTKSLMADLEAAMKAHILSPCFFSFGLDYSRSNYVTNRHDGAA